MLYLDANLYLKTPKNLKDTNKLFFNPTNTIVRTFELRGENIMYVKDDHLTFFCNLRVILLLSKPLGTLFRRFFKAENALK